MHTQDARAASHLRSPLLLRVPSTNGSGADLFQILPVLVPTVMQGAQVASQSQVLRHTGKAMAADGI